VLAIGGDSVRFTIHGTLCCWTVARSQARSGGRILIAAHPGLGKLFERADDGAFAEMSAAQNERDHAAREDAAQTSRVAAEHGV
jgi:hypothetical protein